MPHIGHISEFKNAEETLDMYLERLNEYIVANNIGRAAPNANQATQDAAARQKSAALLSIVGKNACAVLKDIVIPAKPSDKTYEQLCTTLKEHFQPKLSKWQKHLSSIKVCSAKMKPLMFSQLDLAI